MRNGVPTAALRMRAMTTDGVHSPGTFARAIDIPLAELQDRAGELRGLVEARRVGETYVVYARVRDCWPASADIERAVKKARGA